MSDEALRAATFRLESESGAFLGTCFLVHANGTALTCHHVVSHGAALRAIDRFGNSCTATWTLTDDEHLSRNDLALITLAMPLDPAPSPLPLFASMTTGRFRTRVQLREGTQYRESAPFEGALPGAMAIRYHHGEMTYAVQGSAIDGLNVLPGMSGSPLWDVERCAVTGLIAAGGTFQVSGIGGFALPLHNALSSTGLRRLLQENDAEIARFGAEPNQLGAADLLRRATNDTLQRLRDREVILPDKFVAREGFAEAMAGFLNSEFLVFPVGSAAGQGKTSLLAAQASAATDRPTWFVRAIDLATDVGPRIALSRRLREQTDLAPGCDWESFARHSNAAPLLLLDGLNELPMARHRVVDEWLPDLIGDIKRAGWKLVFTTRRELLQQLEKAPVQERLYQPFPEDGAKWFILGRFTSAEADQAIRRYAIPRELGTTIGREPLILRLASTSGSGHSRQKVLDAYVSFLLERANRQLAGRHPTTLMKRLQAIAVAALGREGRGVLAYDHPLAQEQTLIGAFCEANLLEQVDAGYRIVFDEVAEFLIAAGLADHSAPLPLDAFPPNIIALAIERRAARNPDVAIAETVRILDRMTGADRLNHSAEGFRTIVALNGHPAFDDAKTKAIEVVTRDDIWEDILRNESDLPNRLPKRALALLAQTAILHTEGYGWREKDVWSKQHRSTTIGIARAQIGVTRLFHDMLIDASFDGAAMLIEWLGDTRRLSHHHQLGASYEATVGSYALCILLSYQEEIGMDRLFMDVVVAERQGSLSLLEAYCEDRPLEIASLLAGLQPSVALTRLNTVATGWHHLLNDKANGDRLRPQAAAALTPLFYDASQEQLYRLLTLVIAKHIPVEIDLRAQFDRLELPVLDHILIASTVHVRLLTAAEALALADTMNIRDWLVWALAGKWTGPSAPFLLDALVAMFLPLNSLGPAIGSHARMNLEELLSCVSMEAAVESGLDTYIQAQIGGATEPLSPLIYPAFSRWRDNTPGNSAFRLWLAGQLIGSRAIEIGTAFRLASLKALDDYKPMLLAMAKKADLRDFYQLDDGLPRSEFDELAQAAYAAARRNERFDVGAFAALLGILEDGSLEVSAIKELIFEMIFR